MIPGEMLVSPGDIEINANRPTLEVHVENTGDRPIQIGSSLRFDRDATRGYRLDIAAGTAVRFEPGQGRTVRLVRYAGLGQVFGFQGKVMGNL